MPERFNTVMLFGAPGVGKGTQGKLLGCIPGMRHLATGDMFRSMDPHTEIGKRINAIMSTGALVPDELTIQLWQQHVRRLIETRKFAPKSDLLVLDGIPRSVAQADALDPHVNVLQVIHLNAPDIDEMVRRMKQRADKEGRPDDADEKVIRKRFDIYAAETKPVLSHYDRKRIADVNAIGSPAEVLLNILKVLVPLYNKHFENPLG